MAKRINQLDDRIPVATDLMIVGDPISGYSYKASVQEIVDFVAPELLPTRKRFIVGDVGYPADGATTWTDADFDGAVVWLYRNKILQDYTNPADGDSYFTLTGTTITFSPALSASEKINVLIFKV